MQKPIYFDYNATTPTDPEVVKAMLPYMTETFGNSANTLHIYGQEAQKAVETATHRTAQFIHCQPSEIVWNSGSTEGNNTVLFGVVKKVASHTPIHLITSETEHSSVLNTFKAIAEFSSVEVSFVKPNSQGEVLLSEIKKHITPHTKLISITWVNNEIGTINPILEMADFCQQENILFHTDATQALGKVPINLQTTPIDYLTFSSHKFYGPKGVGVLFQRSGHELPALIIGGGHQYGHRSGTLNTPGVVGTAKAIELLSTMEKENERLQNITDFIYSELKKAIPELKLNGTPIGEKRSAINLSLTFPTPIDHKLSQLQGIAFSQGAACKSGKTTASAILSAIGLTTYEASCTLRLSLGRWSTESEAKVAVETISKAFKQPQTMLELNQ